MNQNVSKDVFSAYLTMHGNSKGTFYVYLANCFSCPVQDMLSGIPDGSLPDTLTSIVKASYLEKLEV